jgi:hypothetical protein
MGKYDEQLRRWLATIEVNDDFTEAAVAFVDGSRLEFRHRVDERTAKAVGSQQARAGRVLAWIAMFRLNAKHLDVQFTDGSRWEMIFGSTTPFQRPTGTEPSK